MERVKAGVIGCGNISNAYFNASKTFQNLEVVACADINMEAAKAKAEEHSITALTVDELLGRDDIELIINLTVPKAHTEVNMAALNAGKHVHSEKPFGINLKEAMAVIELAKKKNLRVGCAPDTFLGGGQQTCRKLIDDNWIGRPTSGTAFFLGHGPEAWHPNPDFFYTEGGGPMLDMGPYYITALVNLLGPVKHIVGVTGKAYDERVAGHEKIRGKKIKVEVPTHYAAVLQFAQGAIISLISSFDVYKHNHKPIEIYGTLGSLSVPDPNTFGGDVEVSVQGRDWAKVGHTHGYTDNMRSIGAADMAMAIRTGRKHRCSGELALHVLDVMTGVQKAMENGGSYDPVTTCERPEPMPMGLMNGMI